jgi:hypothetical protein
MFAYMVTFFLVLERFLAVCRPTKYSKLNINKYILTSIVVSFFIGCLYLEFFAETSLLPIERYDRSYYYYMKFEPRSQKVYFGGIYPLLLFIQILALLLLIVFTSAIVRKLQLRNRQISQMFSSVEALEKHNKMIFFCRF